jgi:hypothetical protein
MAEFKIRVTVHETKRDYAKKDIVLKFRIINRFPHFGDYYPM